MPLSALAGIASGIGSVASIFGSIGSLFGGRKKAQNAAPPDLVALRKIAERAGYNPLTALHATGGGGWSQAGSEPPALARLGDVGNALQQVADTGFNREMQQIDLETSRIQRDLLRRELETRHRDAAVPTGQRHFGYSIPQVVEQAVTRHSPSMSPRPRPTMQNVERMPVFLPDGQMRMIPQNLGERLGMRSWDYMMAGDYVEVVGELRGEAENTLAFEPIGRASGVGTFGKPETGDPAQWGGEGRPFQLPPITVRPNDGWLPMGPRFLPPPAFGP